MTWAGHVERMKNPEMRIQRFRGKICGKYAFKEAKTLIGVYTNIKMDLKEASFDARNQMDLTEVIQGVSKLDRQTLGPDR